VDHPVAVFGVLTPLIDPPGTPRVGLHQSTTCPTPTDGLKPPIHGAPSCAPVDLVRELVGAPAAVVRATLEIPVPLILHSEVSTPEV